LLDIIGDILQQVHKLCGLAFHHACPHGLQLPDWLCL
jgi:hypothetical protein